MKNETTYDTYDRRKVFTRENSKKWLGIHKKSLFAFLIVFLITFNFLATINVRPELKEASHDIILEDEGFLKIRVKGLVYKGSVINIKILNIPEETTLTIVIMPKYKAGINNILDATNTKNPILKFTSNNISQSFNFYSRTSFELVIGISTTENGEKLILTTALQNESFWYRNHILLTDEYFVTGTFILVGFFMYLFHNFIFSKTLLFKDLKLGFKVLIGRGPRIRPSDNKDSNYDEVRENSFDYVFGKKK